jgi:hypothetical protein
MRKTYKVLMRTPDGKRTLGMPRRRWENEMNKTS